MTKLVLASELLSGPAASASNIIARSRVLAVLEEAVRLEAEHGEAEAVHDFRVALRRLRTWLRACRPFSRDGLSRRVRRQLRNLARCAGDVRDLQIECAALDKLATGKTARGAVAWFAARLRVEEEAARGALLTALHNDLPDIAERLVRRLWRTVPARSRDRAMMRETIADVIRAHVDNLKSCVNAWRSQSTGLEIVHETRISVKRLRYLLEAFGDAIPQADPATHALGRAQDILGETHDAKLLCDSLAGAVSRARPSVPRTQVSALRRTLQSEVQRALRDARRRAGPHALGLVIRTAARLADTLDHERIGQAPAAGA